MGSCDRRRLLLYVVLPAAAVGLCQALYFSGVDWMMSLASPARNREFGLLENLQNALLLGLALLAWRGARLETARAARWGWRIVAGLVFVVFLEEIDYGFHFLRLARGEWTGAEKVNLHNQGSLNVLLKSASNVVLGVGFGILPFFGKRLPERLRPWLPSRWTLATLLLGVLLSRIGHHLDESVAHNGSLTSNISEFRETITYWVGALYLWELRRRRAGSGAAGDRSVE